MTKALRARLAKLEANRPKGPRMQPRDFAQKAVEAVDAWPAGLAPNKYEDAYLRQILEHVGCDPAAPDLRAACLGARPLLEQVVQTNRWPDARSWRPVSYWCAVGAVIFGEPNGPGFRAPPGDANDKAVPSLSPLERVVIAAAAVERRAARCGFEDILDGLNRTLANWSLEPAGAANEAWERLRDDALARIAGRPVKWPALRDATLVRHADLGGSAWAR